LEHVHAASSLATEVNVRLHRPLIAGTQPSDCLQIVRLFGILFDLDAQLIVAAVVLIGDAEWQGKVTGAL